MVTEQTSDLLDLIREVELRRLDVRGHIYLDYTGAALYPESLLRHHLAQLRDRVLGNPHSTNPASRASTDDISAARLHVLQFFDADPAEYDVCFTANASAAFKLVGESFPWTRTSHLLLTADNHNSINGMREFARRRGARVSYLPLDGNLRTVLPDGLLASSGTGLFAFPAQSNFSGVRHPLSWVRLAQEHGYTVLLDAAAYVPTARLSLRDVPADFVGVSFYKMFGYPTGIGALIARRRALRLLERPWFAGGTVDYVSVGADRHRLRPDVAAFEDGSADFLAASAVSHGLSFLAKIGAERLGSHIRLLTGKLLSRLPALRHSNGAPLICVYGPLSTVDRGGTVAFNVLNRAGAVLDCDAVVAAAAAERISLRSGCFCNPGAAEHAFGFNADDLAAALDGMPREFSLGELSKRLGGRAVGAVRASLGYGSTKGDVCGLCGFLERFRDC